MRHAASVRTLLLWFLFLFPFLSPAQIFVPDNDTWPRPEHPWPQPHPWPHPRVYHWQPLEVSFDKVKAHISDQVATTTVDQEIYNPNPQRLEGTFFFPLPRGAHIDKFTMEIDGKPMEAELMKADKARGIYEDIVRRLKDPALLEYTDRDVLKLRIFPFEPNSKKRITLKYTQLLKADGDVVSYAFPLNTQKFSAKPIKTVSLKVSVETKRPLKTIYSPSHEVEIRRDGERKATIGYEANDIRPDQDFQLFFSQEAGDLGLDLLAHRTGEDEGYFLLLATPAVEMKEREVMAKDVVFVLDTSGSMAGKKLQQAKKALQFCVENLNGKDRFEIVRFSTEVEPLFEKLVDASSENRKRAGEFIDELKPIGGTAIDEALHKALDSRPESSDRPYFVIFLTDGLPTVGTTDEDKIVSRAKKISDGQTRVFCFGIGTDVNTHLLDKIAEHTKAFSQYVLPDEDLEVKLSSFFTKIKEPVLATPKIHFPDGVRATKLYPSPIPDLFKGEQLVLAGRYKGDGKGKIVVEGKVNGDSKKFTYDVDFSDGSRDHEFIPRLWATRRVGYLLDEIRLHGENKELRDEVTQLARKYGIVTPYTAYLILEDERRNDVPLSMQSLGTLNEDVAVAKEAETRFERFKNDKDGDYAVDSARSAGELKSAPTAAAPMEAARKASRASGGYTSPATRTVATNSVSWNFDSKVAQSAQNSQFVSGKNFYQNGTQWVDSDAQKLKDSKRLRIKFNSKEYFDLVTKEPEARPFLALGQNVQFVLKNQLYEIYE